MEKEDFKKSSKNEFKNKWHEKRMYWQFVREMSEEIDKDLSWKWLVQSDLKVQTDVKICAWGKETRLNFGRQKGKIMRHHWCYDTRWLQDTWERNWKDWKISEFEERAEKALIAEKGWGCTSGCGSSGVH